ncbi:TrbI/VirB10 family protein [Xanthomonas campestris pv. raphani]|uniref:TrbI/VirB10 family protein n=1 Tax=Xanthomonas campestris TaxID=339 RepID=UPI00296FED59|nr:TrbI/VirB10 family protein [Xanthomonas campestris]MEA9912995.1 TrbI/VirB10 family protein [Xanthomonas campestris pv. raphani]
MNSNTPNSPDERTPDGRADERVHNEYDERSNPYFARQQASTEPDLDASEPVLRSSDIKRLNRKALVFLALIAGLLILMIFWLASQGSNDTAPAKPRTETVVAPALPQNMTAPVDVAPVPLAQQPNLPPLPPMPTDDGEMERAAAERPRGPTLLERRILAEQSSGSAAGGPGVLGQPAAQPTAGSSEETVMLAKPISNPDGLLVRGTYIRCILETRIISDFGGYTSCIVTEPVYSINGHNLLLPKGSKMLGQYGQGGTRRLQVVWDRVTTPTGLDVTLNGPGIDTLGSSGHPGEYNEHWGNKIASALFISLLSDAFKYAAAEYGPETTTIGVGSGIVTQQPFESNTARSMQQLAEQAVEKSGRRPATLTINQGTVLNVYVAKDVDFSAVLPK